MVWFSRWRSKIDWNKMALPEFRRGNEPSAKAIVSIFVNRSVPSELLDRRSLMVIDPSDCERYRNHLKFREVCDIKPSSAVDGVIAQATLDPIVSFTAI